MRLVLVRLFVAAAALRAATAVLAAPAPEVLAARWGVLSTQELHPGGCAIPDGDGGNYVAWMDRNSSGVHVQRLDMDGRRSPGWGADGVMLPRAFAVEQYPTLVGDGERGVFVSFAAAPSVFTPAASLNITRLLPSGAAAPGWTLAGVAVGPTGGSPHSIMPAPDGAGGVYFAMSRSSDPADTTSAIFVGHLRADGTPADGWSVDGQALAAGANLFDFPQVLADGAGGAFVSYNAVGDDRRMHVHVAHVASDRLTAPGWPDGGVVADTSGEAAGYMSNEEHAVLAADGAGGVYVAWTHMVATSMGDLDVHLQHIRAGGDLDPRWPADGRIIAQSPAQEASPRLTSDAHGGVFVMMRSVGFRFRVTHASPDGTIGGANWPADGLAVGTNAYTYSEGSMSADGLGGVFIGWLNTADVNLAAREAHVVHLSAAGTEPDGGSLEGKTVATAAMPGEFLNLSGDGHGGALLVWTVESTTDDSTKVVATRIAGTDRFARGLHGSQLAVLSCGPNPAHQGTTLALEVPAETRLTVEVYGIDSRRVRTLAAASAGPGVVRYAWDGRDYEGRAVRAGVYVMSATTSRERVNSRVVVIR